MARLAESHEYSKSSRLLVLASTCVVIAALYFARDVLVPLALAVLLSFLLTPAVRWLEKWKMPRGVATISVVLVAVICLGLIGYLVYRQSVSILEQLPKYRAQLSTKVQAFKSRGGLINKTEQELRTIGNAPSTQPASAPSTAGGTAKVSEIGGAADADGSQSAPTAANPLPVRVVTDSPTPWEMISQYGSTILSPLATSGLVLVFVIFMLLDREDLRDRMIRLLGHGRLNLTTQALDEASTRITKYLSALSIVNGVYAACVALGLFLIGHFLGKGQNFPSVLVWGVLVGLLRFVPYIGIFIGAAFPLILSFSLFPGNQVFIAAIILFASLEIVVAQFVEPFWYGASTGMSALAILVSAVFWTWLWGPIGLLLSTPLTVCLVVIGKYVPQLKFIDILLRDTPVLPPHVRVYQRLIAGDQEEANELALNYLPERTLEETYDQVLVAALSIAVQDRHHERIDAERFNSVVQGLREITEELADNERSIRAREMAAATAQAAKTGAAPPPARPPVRLPNVPEGCSVTVLCLPARDEADEIVTLMLAQLLGIRGYCAITTTAHALASEMTDAVEGKKADIVCISAMPPAAVMHARYLTKRLLTRHTNLRLVVGLWTLKGDLKRAKERISPETDVLITTTLAETQDKIEQLAQTLVVQAVAPTGGQK